MIHGTVQAVRKIRILNFQPRRHPLFWSGSLTTRCSTNFQSSFTPSLAPRHGAVKGDQHPAPLGSVRHQCNCKVPQCGVGVTGCKQ